MKNKLIFLYFLITLNSCGVFYYTHNRNSRVVKSNRKETVATVYETPYYVRWTSNTGQADAFTKMEYYINGKKHKFMTGFISTAKAGDQFRMIYNSKHPDYALMYDDEPLIKPDEPIIRTIGKIVYSDKYECEYKYGNSTTPDKYRGIYRLLESQPIPKIGEHFEVEYSKNNHSRSRINLNVPISIDSVKAAYLKYESSSTKHD